MMKDRRNLFFLAALLGFMMMSGPGGAIVPKAPGDELSQKELSVPELYLSNSNQPLEGILESLPNRQAWQSFLAARQQAGEPPVQAFIDPRSGAATNLVGAFPLIPGPGVGNQVTLAGLAARIGRPVQTVDAATVGEAVVAFVREQAQILGVDTAQLGAVRSTQVNPQLWQVAISQAYQGLPVRHGRLAASISHGNLVVIGTETWGDVGGLSTVPGVSAEDAVAAGFAYAGGRSRQDVIVRQPSLEILPVAPSGQSQAFVGLVGTGYQYRLVWTFLFQRSPARALWEVIIDAHDGEVLAFKDRNQYVNRSVAGGVYPVTSTEICPTAGTCGIMQSGWPMPYADTGLASPNNFANSAGIFNYVSGTPTTTLSGKYVKISDNCGGIAKSSPTGYLNLGGVNGQHDCTTGGGGAGDTPASRTAYYEVNKIAEQARGWLPSNTWLQSQLPTNVNIPDTCNAFYDFFSINFFLSGGGCRNTGELAGVFDHEWGHGLDYNDANASLSNSSEAYADIAALYRLQASCLGHGFFWTANFGCGQTSDATGFNVNEAQTGPAHCDIDCSGVRDADWDKHADHTPDTALGFVCNSCVITGDGPCGGEVHCAGAPSRQAAWDLVARDLQAAPFSYSSQTAFLVANKLFFQGSGNIGDWHACTCGSSSSGCGATNAYMQWLTADDDNGNLSDGTPHMTAIYNAFNRHGIACASPAPVNSGCAGGPSAVPTLAGTPGTFSAGLSWSSVPSASEYWVFRTEGHAGCDFGKTKIATTTGLSYNDTQVAAGRTYYYNVVAAGSSSACYSKTSNCVSVAVDGVDTSCQTLTRSHTGSGGDPTASPDHSTGCATGQYHPGELVQLTASPDPGYMVASWTGTDNDPSAAKTANVVTVGSSSVAVTVKYVPPVVLKSINFESDPGLSTTGLWHRTAACAAGFSGHSLPTALYYGIDGQCTYNNGNTNSGTAALPAFSLPNVPGAMLLNYNYYLGTEGLSPYDAATVSISVNGGSYQTKASNHPSAGVQALSDPSGSWKPAALDLSAYAGSSVQLRFGFDTLDSFFNSYSGFYVDDVQLIMLPNCTFVDQDLNLSNQTITTTQLFEACQTITAGTNFVVDTSGDVTLHAFNKVTLAAGFKVLSGGKLKVVVP